MKYITLAGLIFCTLALGVTNNVCAKESFMPLNNNEMRDTLMDIGFPISKIDNDGDYYKIHVLGLVDSQEIGFCFKIKKKLLPALHIVEDEKGLFQEFTENQNFSWDLEGSFIEIDDEHGKNFIKLFCSYYKLKKREFIKKEVVFDTALLHGNLNNLDTHKFNHDDFKIKTEEISTNFFEGKKTPNIIKFKLENVIQATPLIRVQFFITLDLDEGYLYFMEKDTEFRSNFELLFKL